LKIATSENGVTVSSVGSSIAGDNLKRLGPAKKEAGPKIGFRLWNPDQRGLPPVAKAQDDPQPK
jgi:hypothetical protein